MARLKAVKVEYDGIAPPELLGPVTVREWAGELWTDPEPASTTTEWWEAMMLARRRHADAVAKWAEDYGVPREDIRRHVPGRRPSWQ